MAGTTVPLDRGGSGPVSEADVVERRIEALEAGGVKHRGTGQDAVYVWELPVRVTHWAIVFSIVLLAVTGAYIHGPFLVPSSPIEASTQMATIRFIHELTAIVFTIAVGVRFYWGFVGNRYASWRSIIPHNRAQLRSMREMGRYYTFMRSEPVPMTGHNLLAGLAYTVVSILLFLQIATGLLLFAWLIGTGPASWLQPIVSYVPGGIQGVRTLHFFVTFLFFAFLIHHVYSAILVDIEERTGVMTSIFTGFKNIRPHSTADYLTDKPSIGDDAKDARTIAEQSGPAETSKIDA
jgi:Ni/Fe-hydrogenase 1 B-type cytochrome subunit